MNENSKHINNNNKTNKISTLEEGGTNSCETITNNNINSNSNNNNNMTDEINKNNINNNDVINGINDTEKQPLPTPQQHLSPPQIVTPNIDINNSNNNGNIEKNNSTIVNHSNNILPSPRPIGTLSQQPQQTKPIKEKEQNPNLNFQLLQQLQLYQQQLKNQKQQNLTEGNGELLSPNNSDSSSSLSSSPPNLSITSPQQPATAVAATTTTTPLKNSTNTSTYKNTNEEVTGCFDDTDTESEDEDYQFDRPVDEWNKDYTDLVWRCNWIDLQIRELQYQSLVCDQLFHKARRSKQKIYPDNKLISNSGEILSTPPTPTLSSSTSSAIISQPQQQQQLIQQILPITIINKTIDEINKTEVEIPETYQNPLPPKQEHSLRTTSMIKLRKPRRITRRSFVKIPSKQMINELETHPLFTFHKSYFKFENRIKTNIINDPKSTFKEKEKPRKLLTLNEERLKQYIVNDEIDIVNIHPESKRDKKRVRGGDQSIDQDKRLANSSNISSSNNNNLSSTNAEDLIKKKREKEREKSKERRLKHRAEKKERIEKEKAEKEKEKEKEKLEKEKRRERKKEKQEKEKAEKEKKEKEKQEKAATNKKTTGKGSRGKSGNKKLSASTSSTSLSSSTSSELLEEEPIIEESIIEEDMIEDEDEEEEEEEEEEEPTEIVDQEELNRRRKRKQQYLKRRQIRKLKRLQRKKEQEELQQQQIKLQLLQKQQQQQRQQQKKSQSSTILPNNANVNIDHTPVLGAGGIPLVQYKEIITPEWRDITSSTTTVQQQTNNTLPSPLLLSTQQQHQLSFFQNQKQAQTTLGRSTISPNAFSNSSSVEPIARFSTISEDEILVRQKTTDYNDQSSMNGLNNNEQPLIDVDESSDDESELDDDSLAKIHAKNEIEEKRRFFHQIQQIQQENPIPFKRKKELPKEFKAPTIEQLLPSYHFERKTIKLLGRTWNGNLDYLSDSEGSDIETDDSRFDYSDYSDYDSFDESDEFTDSLESDSMFSDSDDDLDSYHSNPSHHHHHHNHHHHHTPAKNSKKQPVTNSPSASLPSTGSKRNHTPSKQQPSSSPSSRPSKANQLNKSQSNTPTSPPLKSPTRSKSQPLIQNNNVNSSPITSSPSINPNTTSETINNQLKSPRKLSSPISTSSTLTTTATASITTTPTRKRNQALAASTDSQTLQQAFKPISTRRKSKLPPQTKNELESNNNISISPNKSNKKILENGNNIHQDNCQPINSQNYSWQPSSEATVIRFKRIKNDSDTENNHNHNNTKTSATSDNESMQE